MNDWLFLVILLFAILLTLIWWGREQFWSRKNQASTSTSNIQQFHAVSITPGKHACEAVKKLHNQRYLATEALQIPLADCDAGQCQCKYQHHSDRRTGRDRRYPSITMEHVDVIKEHRTGKERRRNWPRRTVRTAS